MVAYQNEWLLLKEISDLPAAELVWIVMMLDLIVDKFWRQAHKAPELSYTAEMLQAKNVLLEAASKAMLPALANQAINLPALGVCDVSADNATDEEIGKKYHQPNRWMEDRYSGRVPEAAFNLVGSSQQKPALIASSLAIETIGAAELDRMSRKELAGRTLLAQVDATSFGSPAKLNADRKYIARVNLAKAINLLAQEEFEATKEEVLNWYRDRVQKNHATLMSWAGNLDLWIDDGMGMHGDFSSYHGQVGHVYHKRRNFVNRHSLESNKQTHRSMNYLGCILLGRSAGEWRTTCQLTGTKASFWVIYSPATSFEIALLAGCEVSDLPDVLQNWSRLKPYAGNSILDRVDPMTWVAKNPWLDLDLRVLIGLSKRGLARVMKAPIVTPPLVGLTDDPELRRFHEKFS